MGIDRPLWGDERATLWFSTFPIWDMVLHPRDETPFLYYALHKLFLSDATSPAHVRLLAFAAGAIAVPLMYVPGRMLAGRDGGLTAALLLALWPLHVQYSQEARAHSLLFLVILLSLTGFIWWVLQTRSGGSARRRQSALGLFGLGAVLSFYTHLLALFWLAIIMPIFVCRAVRLPNGKQQMEALICMALMAVAALPGLRWLYLRLTEGHAYYWLDQASPLQAASVFVGSVSPPLQAGIRELVTGDLGVPLATASALLALAVLPLILVGKSSMKSLKGLRCPSAVSVALIGLTATPLILWAVGTVFPILSTRNIVWAASGPILLWAILFTHVHPRLLRLTAIGCASIGLLLTCFMLVPTYSSDCQPRKAPSVTGTAC